MNSFEPKLLLGFLQGLWGIKGWLKVYSYTNPKNNIAAYSVWWIGNSQTDVRQVHIEECVQRGKNGLAAKIEGVNDRDQAASLLGQKIWIFADQLAPLENDEYYWHQLIGLNVVNLKGMTLGQVSGLMETGAHDVLVVKGSRERLIPYVMNQIVHSVNLSDRTITVDWDRDY